MAPDQTYCVACGERRGDLPSRIAKLIGTWDTPIPPSIAGVPPLTAATALGYPTIGFTAVINDWLENATFPSPRVAALAVMTLLGFGVLMGSVVGATNTMSPLYVMAPAAPVAAQTPPPAAAEVAGTGVEVAAEAASEPTGPTDAAAVLPPSDPTATKVNHVWLIVLSGQGYDKTFGNPAAQSYLTSELVGKGQLIQNYYAVAQGQLANSMALVSGQGPTWQSLANCPVYNDLLPGTLDPITGQVLGDGCVHPETVKTLPDAIAATGKSTYAYVEGIDNGVNGRSSACAAPTSGSADADHVTTAANPYASWSNPYLYFKSFISSPNCQFQLGGLNGLATDLTAGRSPAFSLVVPNRCRAGSELPCAPGAPTGLSSSDAFLQEVIPKITSSKDYLDGGLIAITFDNAPQGTPEADISGCCGQPEFTNLATPPAAPAGPTSPAGPEVPTGPTGQSTAIGAISTAPSTQSQFVAKTPTGENAGGGKVGLLLISPMIKEGVVNTADEANHFSMLLSIENWFGTEKLGLTNASTVAPLPDSIFNKDAVGG